MWEAGFQGPRPNPAGTSSGAIALTPVGSGVQTGRASKRARVEVDQETYSAILADNSMVFDDE